MLSLLCLLLIYIRDEALIMSYSLKVALGETTFRSYNKQVVDAVTQIFFLLRNPFTTRINYN